MKKLLLSLSLWSMVLSVSAQEATVDFGRDIFPLFKTAGCFECHGPDRQRGKLRLDTKEGLFKDAHVVVAGDIDASEIIYRISLPRDDDDAMPPLDEGKPLTEGQVNLVRQWIMEGAQWNEPAPSLEAEKVDFARDILPILDGLSEDQRDLILAWAKQGAPTGDTTLQPAPVNLVAVPTSEEETAAIAKLQDAGVLVMKLSQAEDWLEANFKLRSTDITDEHLAPLAKMPNLTDLDLSRTAITDAGLENIEALTNLTRLNLNNTGITDAGLEHISGLSNLAYLNLFGTKVTDEGLEQLHGLKSLAKIFLWQTEVTDEGAAAFQKSLPAVEINRGRDHVADAEIVSIENSPASQEDEPAADDNAVAAQLVLDSIKKEPDNNQVNTTGPTDVTNEKPDSSIANVVLDANDAKPTSDVRRNSVNDGPVEIPVEPSDRPAEIEVEINVEPIPTAEISRPVSLPGILLQLNE